MAEKIFGGALLAIFGGICNGSWLVPTRESAPSFLQVSSPSSGLPWEAFWFVFMVSALVLNSTITLGSMGSDLITSIQRAPPSDVGLVCLFFFLWGLGTTGFGLAVKRAGIALGTSLVLAVVVVVGTALPLVYDFDSSKGQAGFIIVGVMVACVGFGFMARASLMKEMDQARKSATPAPARSVAGRSVAGRSTARADGGGSTAALPSSITAFKADDVDTIVTAANPVFDVEAAEANPPRSSSMSGATRGTIKLDNAVDGDVPRASVDLPTRKAASKAAWLVNILVCAAAGILSAMMNFGFVFGDSIRDRARDLGASKFVSSMPVWFLAICMCSVPGLVYASYLLTANGTWGSLQPAQLTPRRGVLSALCALLWCANLHLYGLATFWLGDLGTAIAWPLMLVSTILTASGWSTLLHEWDGVKSRTVNVNMLALLVLIASVLIISGGGFYGEYS